MSPGFQFHAVPPDGEWFNDPNALFHANGRYHLYVQHRADVPDFARVGWAGLSTEDLLHWNYRGVVIPPDGAALAYSGSMSSTDDALEIWYTEDECGMERQLKRVSDDLGESWSAPTEVLGPAARDWRDPFAFHEDGGTTMLIARTCGWSTWAEDAPSVIEIWRRDGDDSDWMKSGEIGPWRPKGVMWEVPVLVRLPNADATRLIVSEIDRREDRSEGRVLFWDGTFSDDGFRPRAATPQPLDCGPDFYAAIPNLETGWPLKGRVLVGWASNWQTARLFDWGGFHGGPISLPRLLTAKGSAPLPQLVAAFTSPCSAVPRSGMGRLTTAARNFTLEIASGNNRLTIERSVNGALTVMRTGSEWLAWTCNFAPTGEAGPIELTLFVDGPVAELHIGPDDRWVTAVLPVDQQAFGVSLPFQWFKLTQPA